LPVAMEVQMTGDLVGRMVSKIPELPSSTKRAI